MTKLAPGPPLPCLKEHAWAGREGAVCRPLWPGNDSPHMPLVAFGYDHPHTFEFINNDRLPELNVTREALEAQALQNLHARPAAWQSFDADVGDGKRLQMLVVTDDFFAAEHVLHPDALRDAQRRLNARALLVGVPRRGVLFATTVEQDRLNIVAFAGLIARQFARGETAPISPLVFTVSDGAILGAVDPPAGSLDLERDGAGEDDEEGDDDEFEGDAADEGAPYITAMVVRNDAGTEDVHLMAGGEDGERLAKGIESAFMELLSQHIRRPEFSGHIRIVVLGMTPAPARKDVPRLLEHLRGIASEVSRGEKKMQVSLTYQRDTFGSPPAAAAPAKTAAAPAKTAAAAAKTPRAPFAWWTDLPSWLRIAIGLLIGMVILWRIMLEMALSW